MAEKNKRIRPVVEEIAVETVVDRTEGVAPESATSDAISTPIEKSVETPVLEEPENDGKPEKKKTNFKLVLIITILTALVVGFVSGGVYVYFTGVKQTQSEPEVKATPTPVPTIEPTPSPSPEPEEIADLSVYKISILNGSGKIGEAGRAKDIVEEIGFTVSDTGNAASFNFDASIIEAKTDVPKSVVSKLKSALEGNYKVELGDALAAASDYDIVITVGAE